MRLITLTPLLFLLSPLSPTASTAHANPDTGLYPPGLVPLINKANILLSTGQFGEAAKVYSEAIDQSPADYLLYYKRATAYFSMQRHTSALEDFEKVLSLTSHTFDNAHLMKARIHTREGLYDLARHSLGLYIKAKGRVDKEGKPDKDIEELEAEIDELEKVRSKTEKERNAGLWNACVESASLALRVASHDVQVRTWRAECALAAGDVESAVGDLTRLSHLLSPSTQLLTHIYKLSYFLLPPSPTPLTALKQCLHFDPDSKPCLALHRQLKALDRGFTALETLQAKEDWRGVVKLLMSPAGGKQGMVYEKYESAMMEAVGEQVESEVIPLVPEELIKTHYARLSPSSSDTPTATGTTTGKTGKGKTKKQKPVPIHLPVASTFSPKRQTLVRALCVAYTHLTDLVPASSEYPAQMAQWCRALLTLDGCGEDTAGLVGVGESHIRKEEWEDAVRVLEKAFEASGRADRAIHGRLSKAQSGLKRSRQKDYYKIVGVSRDADAKTIKKAYRQAAKSAHPDKGGSEGKMAALNEAYEVLSNPEMRARYDAGEDPMDPSGGGQGNPFAGHGGSPFGHGGGNPFGGAGGGGHPFQQFFQQQQGGRSGGFQFHFGH